MAQPLTPTPMPPIHPENPTHQNPLTPSTHPNPPEPPPHRPPLVPPGHTKPIPSGPTQ